jgi:hypothetical protein
MQCYRYANYKYRKGYLGIALAMAMMSENSMYDNSEKPREFIPKRRKEPKTTERTFIIGLYLVLLLMRITKEECLN